MIELIYDKHIVNKGWYGKHYVLTDKGRKYLKKLLRNEYGKKIEVYTYDEYFTKLYEEFRNQGIPNIILDNIDYNKILHDLEKGFGYIAIITAIMDMSPLGVNDKREIKIVVEFLQ